MSFKNAYIAEFDQEMKSTRTLLERVPADRLDWRPHEKSYTLGELATHIGNLLTWADATVKQDEFDVAPEGQERPRGGAAASVEDVLAGFDRNATAAREAIGAVDDEHLQGPWSLLNGGKTLFTMPRSVVLRSFVLNHLIHHRAQLTVYLRLCDVPLPVIYGPSADESW
jgi:uncharacterized damage-inducible protein DinB